LPTASGVLVVAANQGKGHSKVGNRVGAKQQGKAAPVPFVAAPGAGALRDDHRAVPRPVERLERPAPAVREEALGQLEAEVAPPGGAGALEGEAVVQEAVAHGSADEAVAVGLGRHAQRPGAEGRPAAAAGLVRGVGDVEEGHLAVSQRAATTLEGALAPPALAASGAGIAPGGAADDADNRHAQGLGSWEARR